MPIQRHAERRRAIIVGGSIAGLFTGLLLRRNGWHVEIFERLDTELAARGAGIVTHPELWGALDRAGISWKPSTLGVQVCGRVVLDTRGNVIGERAYTQIMTSWGRLYSILRAALPNENYHSGTVLDRVERIGGRVTALFEDGTIAHGDLLVGADGIYSTVRRQFLPTVKPAYAGYVAWRGLVDEHLLSRNTREVLCNRLGFCLPPREQMLGYPVAGAGEDLTPGRRRYNFVWYRPADQIDELPRLLRDQDGKQHEVSIPPRLIRDEVIAEMRRDAARLLAPQFAEVVRCTEQPLIQPIFDLETPTMAMGRVVLLGDAAFVARPHVGMGITKAAGDAVGLCSAFDQHPRDFHAAIEDFDKKRRHFGATVVSRARHLGAYMQAQIRTSVERELAERHRTPGAVMNETAVPEEILPRTTVEM
jgi:2-polyprenyl-6-methoxyphenol hydroxylase-like FAD-dependent oxidoreductase